MSIAQPATSTPVSTDEFEHEAVPPDRRRRWPSVAAVWFGFPMILTNTVFGGVIVYGLGFAQGMIAIAAGNLVLLAYVGALSHNAGSTGNNFAMMAKSTFGTRGYALASGFLSTIVIGWFAFQTGLTGSTLQSTVHWNGTLVALLAGIAYVAIAYLGIRALAAISALAAPLFLILGGIAVALAISTYGASGITSYQGHGGLTIGAAITITVAGFADSGTMTADFTRWARNGKHAVFASVTAFPVAYFLSMLTGGLIVAAGAAAHPATEGGDFLGTLVGHGLVLKVVAIAFVFINLGSVCTHCLYNGAVGWSHITHRTMRLMTIALGAVGVVAAVAGVWTYFDSWLNILGIFVPPIGAVLIIDQIVVRPRIDSATAVPFRWSALAAWALGAAAAAATHFAAPQLGEAVVGILIGALSYALLERLAPTPASRTGKATLASTTPTPTAPTS